MEKSKSYYRDDNDIAGGDESGAPHGGVLNTDLLEAGGKGKKQSTGNSSLPEKLSGGSVPDRICFLHISWEELVQNKNTWHKYQTAQQAAYHIEGKGFHVVHPHALCHKGSAPDRGGEQEKERISDFYFLHVVCPFIFYLKQVFIYKRKPVSSL